LKAQQGSFHIRQCIFSQRACTWAATLVVLCSFTAALFGQAFTSSVSGTVMDPAGTAVPNATEIRNTATNDVRRVSTGSDGSYIISNLAPGPYELSAQATGFKRFVQRNVVLTASTAASYDVHLELGAVEQTVEVSAAAVLLDTQSADNAATLSTEMLAQLPTSTRSPLNFVYAFAGTTEGPFGNTASSTTDQNFSTFGMMGGRSGNTEILLDGAPATAVDWGGLMVSPTIDAVQEMQVIRNTYDAQYGRSGGGVVSIVSKSGTNKFHGTGYECFRNDNLDANTWSNNRGGAPRGEFKRNQFGGNLSGPIWASKNLFFFGAYEGLRQPYTAESGFLKVPTALERQGDFSQTYNDDGTLAVIYNPFSTRAIPNPAGGGGTIYTRDPFDASCIGVTYPNTCAGNKIPASLLNPAGQKVAALFPEPNRPAEGLSGFNNFFKQGGGNVINDKVEARVDWVQNEKHRIFGRWSQRIRQSDTPPCFFCNGADTNFTQANPGWHTAIGDTITPSPTWVINVVLGLSRWNEEQLSPSLGVINAGDLGLNPTEFQAPVIPTFFFDTYTGLGNQKVRKFARYNHSLQGNVTHEFTNHSLHFGASGELLLINNVDRFSAQFGFGRAITGCDPTTNASGAVIPGAPCTAPQQTLTSGNDIAALLMGIGGGDAPLNPDKAMSQRAYGAYIQDNWRVNRRLTLNLGLRYETQRPATDRFDRLAYFNPNVTNPLSTSTGLPLLGGIQYAGPGNRDAWPADNLDLAPRLGLALKLTDKLVMRAGYGIFYNPASAMISFDDPGQFYGFSTDTTWVGTVGGAGFVPRDLLNNPFPTGKNQPTGKSEGLLTGVGQQLFQAWPLAPHPTGYKQHYSLDFQYELGRGSVIEVGYQGFRARKLMYGNPSLDANQLPPQFLSLGPALDEQVPNPFYGKITSGVLADETVPRQRLLRPFPEYDSIQWTRSLPGAKANFDSLNAKFSHQFRGGLSILSTYQWSKLLDTGSEDYIGWGIGGQWRDYYNTNVEYSVSTHDLPHSFVTALVYDLPVGRGKKFGGSMPAVAEQVIGGWQVSSIVRITSGYPLPQVTTQGNALGNYGFGVPRPNLVGDVTSGTRTTEQWFNTDAFQAPGNYEIGNAPRDNGNMRDRGARNLDLSLAKVFRLTETFRLQFRGDFLNLFNTPQYSGVDTSFGDPGFGQVFGVRNPPRNIQLGLKLDF
jgi:hypothetical protein